MSFYTDYYNRFLSASAEMREQSKKHWLKIHAENLKTGRNDLIIFSAQVLAAAALAESKLANR